MFREVRNFATWVTMSCMFVLLTNNMRSFLSADAGVVLFVFTFFGIGTAALAQFAIWVEWVIGIFSKVRTIGKLADGSLRHERWLI